MTDYFDYWVGINTNEGSVVPPETIRPLTREAYEKLVQEGRDGFNKSKNPNEWPCPYADDRYAKFPYMQGFRDETEIYFKKKYRIEELQTAVRKLVEARGCIVEYTDEYATPYLKSPEGWRSELA